MSCSELWNLVKENPSELASWERLVVACEQDGDSSKTQEAYSAFLSEFPLLHVYWKKYAEFQSSISTTAALTIYQTAVKACPFVPELWMDYTSFMQTSNSEPSSIREVYVQALSTVGLFATSSDLWMKWAEYEQSIEGSFDQPSVEEEPTPFFSDVLFLQASALCRSLGILLVALTVPTRKLQDIYEYAVEIIEKLNVSELFKPPVLAEPLSSALAFPSSFQSKLTPLTSPSQHSSRDSFLSSLEEFYSSTLAEFNELTQFESELRRTWFSPKPLPPRQLSVWRDYLVAVQSMEKDKEYVLSLFNRCVVTCANYLEFWVMFGSYCVRVNQSKVIVDRIRPASDVFLKYSPRFKLFALTLLEMATDFDADDVSKEYSDLLKSFPDDVCTALQYAGFLLRIQQKSSSFDLFRTYLAKVSSDQALKVAFLLSQIRILFKNLPPTEAIAEVVTILLNHIKPEFKVLFIETFSFVKNDDDVCANFLQFLEDIITPRLESDEGSFLIDLVSILTEEQSLVNPKRGIELNNLKCKVTRF
ncbi:hypothetical protein P9112_009673 [Eukaryota sp. TZLM1-RC]